MNQALNRVKAAYTSFNDNEYPVGSYQTNDIKEVLKLIELQEKKLEFIKKDLEDLIDLTDGINCDKMLIVNFLKTTLMAMK